MQIQVHSDNHIEGSARLADWVSASVAGKLDRYDDELTRVVVHLNDENGDKAGAHDKRCQIEARPRACNPSPSPIRPNRWSWPSTARSTS